MTARSATIRTVRRALGVWSVALLLLAVTYHEVAPGVGAAISQPPDPIVATADLPDGPGTTEPGLLLVVAVLPDGSLDISEFVRFVAPVASIDVRVPDVSRAGSMFATATPTVTGLQIISSGSRTIEGGDGSRSIALPASTTSAELRYQVAGTTERTEPSSAGRALAAVAPILSEQPGDFPVAFTVTGSGVRNLFCPDRPLAEQACATGAPPTLSVTQDLLWPEALVVVQVDVRP